MSLGHYIWWGFYSGAYPSGVLPTAQGLTTGRGGLEAASFKTVSISSSTTGRGTVHASNLPSVPCVAVTTGRGGLEAASFKTVSISSSTTGRGTVHASNLPSVPCVAVTTGRGAVVYTAPKIQFYFLDVITTGAGASTSVVKKTIPVVAYVTGGGSISHMTDIFEGVRGSGFVYALTTKIASASARTTGGGIPYAIIRIGGCCDYSLIRLDQIEAEILAGQVAAAAGFSAVLTAITALSARSKKKVDTNDDHKLLISIQSQVLDLEKKIRRGRAN